MAGVDHPQERRQLLAGEHPYVLTGLLHGGPVGQDRAHGGVAANQPLMYGGPRQARSGARIRLTVASARTSGLNFCDRSFARRRP